MNSDQRAVFFYGLFMDESLLASKGITPSRSAVGYIDGYALRIGARATLVPDGACRVHGILMILSIGELNTLYSEESVADYMPETVSVVMADGSIESAECYVLPAEDLQGTNPGYAEALLELARELGLPGEYLREIQGQAGHSPESRS